MCGLKYLVNAERLEDKMEASPYICLLKQPVQSFSQCTPAGYTGAYTAATARTHTESHEHWYHQFMNRVEVHR